MKFSPLPKINPRLPQLFAADINVYFAQNDIEDETGSNCISYWPLQDIEDVCTLERT
jgi:hypothetical protein